MPNNRREWATFYQKVVSGQDETGADVYTWGVVHRGTVEVLELKGREFQAAQQRFAEAQYEVWMLYKRGIEPRMELQIDGNGGDGGERLEILSVVDPKRDKMKLHLICKQLL